jgi:flagellar hook protein FlgE
MGIEAMFSGVSGLQAHSTWLDVIGNNISNVNTVAYKASRLEFADQISQQMSYASGADTGSGIGGVNGEQIGLGTRVQSIQTLFTQGTAESTGNSSDVMIDGDGFLISNVAGKDFLTRAGNLTTDGAGNLVDASGGMIQGWRAVSKFTTHEISSIGALQVTDASLQLDTATAPSAIQITTGMTCPAKATSTMTFTGNLDAALKATDSAHGGLLDLGSINAQSGLAAAPVVANAAKIPLTQCTFNVAKAALVGTPAAYAAAASSMSLNQLENLADPAVAPAAQNVVTGVVETGVGIAVARTNLYMFDNAQEMASNPPAVTFTQNVYDSNGNAKEITYMAWQVNDQGDAGVNATATGTQAAYAWYAFDTTGGAKAISANLVGGTGITETYDRGVAGSNYTGDLLYFNTDGSLASQGDVVNGTVNQAAAHLYLTPLSAGVSPIPTVGAEIMDVTQNFGTSGILTQGKRDGLYSDAAGTYTLVNGVNTYVPNQSASCSKQNGYGEGTLQSYSFDTTGKIQGSFSNGQTIVLGQLAMARVDNPEGLTKAGGDYYVSSANSGNTYVGTAGENGIGSVVGGELEGSNVDLTTELTNMIIAQRGFEVNAQVVTTENQELQTLVHLGQ